jgi:hypothetical protein
MHGFYLPLSYPPYRRTFRIQVNSVWMRDEIEWSGCIRYQLLAMVQIG